VPVTQSLIVEVTMTKGSRVNINVTFGDGSHDTIYVDKDLSVADKVRLYVDKHSSGSKELR